MQSILSSLSPHELNHNPTFSHISRFIPGNNNSQKLEFICNSFNYVKKWIRNFVIDRDLTPDKIFNSMENFVEFPDDKLDYVAAFLDMNTNYFEHTGTQSLAKSLIEKAYSEI